MTTYIALSGDTITSQTDYTEKITLYNDNNVVFNIKGFNDSNNKIIKIEVIWDNHKSSIPDMVINYEKIDNLRGNMINAAISNNDNSITTIFEHFYQQDLAQGCTTVIKLYTINGTIFKQNIEFSFSKYDFFETIGDINILNTQFIDNEYNYLFVVAETAKKDIIHFCLKQQANRGNVRKPGQVIVEEGEIVKITDSSTYLCTIDNLYPLYLINTLS